MAETAFVQFIAPDCNCCFVNGTNIGIGITNPQGALHVSLLPKITTGILNEPGYNVVMQPGVGMYGGEANFLDPTNNTVTMPAGWVGINVPADDDETYVTIPDIGFDFPVNGQNLGHTVEVYDNWVLKFDQQGFASFGTQSSWFPDNDTPNAVAVHFGSYDGARQHLAYSNIVEAGVKGIVIRQQGNDWWEYNSADNYSVETALFENGRIAFRIQSNISPLRFIWPLHNGNWGVTSNQRWLTYIDPPLSSNAQYTLYPSNSRIDKIYPYLPPNAQPSFVILVRPEINQPEPNEQVQFSRFTNITITSNVASIAERPDVVYAYAFSGSWAQYNFNLLNNPTVLDWISNGTLLYLTCNPQHLNTFLVSTFGLLNDKMNMAQFNDIAPVVSNPYIRRSHLGYYGYGYSTPLTNVHNSCTPLAFTPTGNVSLVGRPYGNGYVILDLIQLFGHPDRVAVFNDFYDYVYPGRIQQYYGAGMAAPFFVSGGGNVGVHTDAPVACLHVDGALRSSGLASAPTFATASVSHGSTIDVAAASLGITTSGAWTVTVWRSDDPAHGNVATTYYSLPDGAFKTLDAASGSLVGLSLATGSLRITNSTGSAGTFTVACTRMGGA